MDWERARQMVLEFFGRAGIIDYEITEKKRPSGDRFLQFSGCIKLNGAESIDKADCGL